MRGERVRDRVVEHLSANAENNDSVAATGHVGHNVGRQDGCLPVGLHIRRQDIKKLAASERIETCQWFIQEQDVSTRAKSDCKADLSGLPA